MSQKEAIAKAPAKRVRRTSLDRKNLIGVTGKEPGYEYRIVNDDGDRVQEFLDNGWEVVPAKDVRVGEKRINAASEEGSAAMASVGQGQKAYVLRIREDWYKEDQEAKAAHIDATEAATQKEALDGYYGKVEINKRS